MKLLSALWILITGITGLSINTAVSQNVGISSGNASPDSSAILDLNATNRGFLIPRMTGAQRDSIKNPANALMIFNTTAQCLEIYYTGEGWYRIYCKCLVSPDQPGMIIGDGMPCRNKLQTYSVSPVPGALTYKWTFPSGWTINAGQGTNSVQVLTDSTSGKISVSASNSCGTSPVQDKTVVTLNCGAFCEKIVGGNFDYAEQVITTFDWGYAVAANTNSFGAGDWDLYVIRLDISGNILWTRTVGGSGDERGWDIVQNADSGFTIAGRTQSFSAGDVDAYLVRLDKNGNILWTSAVGGSGNDDARALIKTADGGFLVAGGTVSFGAGSEDMYIIKFDASGNVIWTRTLGGTAFDLAEGIAGTTDGDFVVGGTTSSIGAGNYDFYAARFHSDGSLVWTRSVGTSSPEICHSLVMTADGGFAMAGDFQQAGQQNHEMYVVKLAADGTLSWAETIGTASIELGNDILEIPGGDLVVTGRTSADTANFADFFMVRLDQGGNVLSSNYYGTINGETSNCVTMTKANGFLFAGQVENPQAYPDIFLVQTEEDGSSCCKLGEGAAATPMGTAGSGGTTGTGGIYHSGGVPGAGGTVIIHCHE